MTLDLILVILSFALGVTVVFLWYHFASKILDEIKLMRKLWQEMVSSKNPLP